LHKFGSVYLKKVMAVSVDAVASDLAQIDQVLSVLASQASKIGTAADTPGFRDSVRSKVEVLSALSHSLKSALLVLRDRRDPSVDSYERRFKALASRVASTLRPFIGDGQVSRPPPSYTDSAALLLGRDPGEDMADTVDLLEHQAREVLATMREVNQLFHATCEEIKRQRKLLTKIDTHIEEADKNMAAGGGELRIAQEHERRSSKCMCSWCLVAFALVAIFGGVIYFLAFYHPPADTDSG
jgi:hypothetical protein